MTCWGPDQHLISCGLITLASLLPPDKATYLVSGTGSPALTALYSSQSIILAGFFLLPTETKLLKLQNQENSFPLSFCSIIPSPEAMSMEYLKFLNERSFKGYQRMLRESGPRRAREARPTRARPRGVADGERTDQNVYVFKEIKYMRRRESERVRERERNSELLSF